MGCRRCAPADTGAKIPFILPIRSLYEAILYVRGRIKSLGADAQVEDMTAADYRQVGELLQQANFPYNPAEFKRVASMRRLYHWNADAYQAY